jgi:hypothetical protein
VVAPGDPEHYYEVSSDSLTEKKPLDCDIAKTLVDMSVDMVHLGSACGEVRFCGTYLVNMTAFTGGTAAAAAPTPEEETTTATPNVISHSALAR